jgi:hydroxymethylpyrimidine/phosphomethylpyrimidine kinase
VYGEAVVTLHTVQNSLGVSHVEAVAPELLRAQLLALFDDMPPRAVKTGAFASRAAIAAVAELLSAQGPRAAPLVVDPILRASSGHAFARDDLARAFLELLAPLATLLTPNTIEAGILTGLEITDVTAAERAARALLASGAQGVLVKGGHLPGEPVDVLVSATGESWKLPAPRVDTRHTHGTGCTYSAAICARLAQGEPLERAVHGAKAWLVRVLAAPLGLGRGRGPLNHLVPVDAP